MDITHVRNGEPPPKRAAPSIQLGAGFKWNLQALSSAADAVQSGGKSPVSALNELGVRVSYTVRRMSGPAHCPSFTVTVCVADMLFEGLGHSKREARAAAARACLHAVLARAGRVILPPSAMTTTQDYTEDVTKCNGTEFECVEMKLDQTNVPTRKQPDAGKPTRKQPDAGKPTRKQPDAGKPTRKQPDAVAMPPPPPPPAPPAPPSAPAPLFPSPAPPSASKSPINLLYENYPGLVWHCSFGDGTPLELYNPPMQLSHSMRFKVVCVVKDQKFEGYGSSKKLAKLAASRAALATLQESRSPAPSESPSRDALPQTLADHVAKLVNEKFNDLMKDNVAHSKRKVLAGIVITTDNRIEGARVIAVTTGTKCVSGEHMSVRGRALNDCHAEVAARRCLQRYVYSHLYMYRAAADPTVPIESSDLEPLPSGGYQLKPNLQLHLYVSTAPCGDGRIFSPHESADPSPDRHPNRLARGQLRTKIESGEGTIPVKNSSNIVQTWDGVMQGERLLTMSCSDKVALWQVCGLQGSLLSVLVRPLYLTSIVLGSLLHPHHMYRAICGRFERSLAALPTPHRLQRPLLARAASAEVRSPARAPNIAAQWTALDKAPEIVNATTGKLENGQPSLLCKQSMFARWLYLVQGLPLLPQSTEFECVTPELPAAPDQLLYSEAKQISVNYQTAKQRLIAAFETASLGRWVKKPLEQDQFPCEIVDASPRQLFS